MAMKDKRMFKMATPKLFSLTVLAASALAISTPAMADWKHKEVQFGDLDLSSASGQKRLASRVKRAVTQVCATPRAFTLAERADQIKCEQNAMANAKPKVSRAIAAYMENRRLASGDINVVAGN
ncbi:MAG: UrcA family protein [Sphingomonadaceae bacterium]|nr:UrcA family protein [Sphingomonadaceae bacterium]